MAATAPTVRMPLEEGLHLRRVRLSGGGIGPGGGQLLVEGCRGAHGEDGDIIDAGAPFLAIGQREAQRLLPRTFWGVSVTKGARPPAQSARSPQRGRAQTWPGRSRAPWPLLSKTPMRHSPWRDCGGSRDERRSPAGTHRQIARRQATGRQPTARIGKARRDDRSAGRGRSPPAVSAGFPVQRRRTRFWPRHEAIQWHPGISLASLPRKRRPRTFGRPGTCGCLALLPVCRRDGAVPSLVYKLLANCSRNLAIWSTASSPWPMTARIGLRPFTKTSLLPLARLSNPN